MARAGTLLDLLCRRYPDHSRETLLGFVLCGEVTVDGSVIKDPKLPVAGQSSLEVRQKRFVSRGGEKLDHALTRFSLDVSGLVCVDAGASTGGFTDCLLQRGARFVHAIDVGTNQLAYRLRVHERVAVREKTSILKVDHLDPPAAFAVADLSFRSLSGAAGHLLSLAELREAVVLIKPQFEWLDPPPEFSGTVPRDQALSIVSDVVRSLQEEGVHLLDICESPIAGREGNREFPAYIAAANADGRGLSAEDAVARLSATS